MTGWFAQTLVEPLSFHQFIDNGFRGATFNAFLPQTFKTDCLRANYRPDCVFSRDEYTRRSSGSGPCSNELCRAGLALSSFSRM